MNYIRIERVQACTR